jgi:hypothetical protein
MSLKHVDMESAMRRLADRRIEEAMCKGKFDNLPGKGQPIELEPVPADENARLTWWALKILRQNDVIPEQVTWRKALDHLQERLTRAQDESAIRSAVAKINELVHRINSLGTNVLPGQVMRLSEAEELEKFRGRGSEKKRSNIKAQTFESRSNEILP